MHVCNERLFLFPEHRQPEGEMKALSPRSPSSSDCVLVSESAGKDLPTAPLLLLPAGAVCLELPPRPFHQLSRAPRAGTKSSEWTGTKTSAHTSWSFVLFLQEGSSKKPCCKIKQGARGILRAERQFKISHKKKNKEYKKQSGCVLSTSSQAPGAVGD